MKVTGRVKRWLSLLGILGILLGIAGCGKKPATQETAPSPGGEIKLGCVLSTTGQLGPMGKKMADAARLAVDQINARGGVDGKRIKLYLEDDATDQVTALNDVKKLVEVNGVKLLIGGMSSGAAMTIGPFLAERHVFMISPSATSPELTGQPWRQYLFRTCPSDIYQGKLMAQLALNEGLKKAVILAMDNTYGVGLGNEIKKTLGDKAQVVGYIKYDPNKKDYRSELTQIKQLNPDVVFHIGYNKDGIIIYQQALNLGLDKIKWIGCDGVYGTGMLENPAAAEFMAKTMIGTRPASPDNQAYEQFRQAYKAKFNAEPEVFCDTIYDAVNLLAQAYARAGGEDAAKIREALLQIGQNYPGVSGNITFDQDGDRVGGYFEVWKVIKKGDKYEFAREKLIEVQ
ncbi:ABC transporter substrate-binding protein [Desulfothermobacter acidiphilus]|uniref:ABC transporter substrate-binding protein n=1 Tax=Desulfothermobacter acidiphilus TaxID=1938353 RepID=UPI003F8CE7B7